MHRFVGSFISSSLPLSYRRGKQICDYLCKQSNLHWTFAEEYSKSKLSAKFVTIRENRYTFLI